MSKRRQLVGRKKNYCCAFILPMVNINHKNLPSNFINGYINDNYEVFLVFEKSDDNDIIFNHFLNNAKVKNMCFLNIINNNDEIIVKYKVPEKHYDNFNLFIKGKYSKFDDEYKKIIVSYFGNTTVKDNYSVTEYNTIYPQDFKRKQIAERLYDKKDIKEGLKLIDEVLDIPDLQRETFKTIEELQTTNQLNITN